MRTLLIKVARRLYDMAIRAPRGRGVPIAVDAWNRDYAAGSWSKLADFSEFGRYLLIVNYVKRLVSKPRILDVGCGEGLLRSHFDAASFASYTGTDISEIAVRQASEKRFAGSSFHVANFEFDGPPGAFEVVIFNEAICYARNPAAVFQRYWDALPEGGVIVVSIYRTGLRTTAIWRTLERVRRSDHATRITNENGQTWDVRVFKKQVAI